MMAVGQAFARGKRLEIPGVTGELREPYESTGENHHGV
jgi:hypothetical protein